MFEIKKPSSSIDRLAGQVQGQRKAEKILPAFIAVALILLVLIYVVSVLFNRYGSFTIKVEDFGNTDYALALSENENFLSSSARLNAKEIRDATNITYDDLPSNLNDVNGSHNGDNYLAYTFYLKNAGKKTCTYSYSLLITRATINIDAAVRVRVYFNPNYYKAETDETNYSGEYIDYAKPKTGSNGEVDFNPDNRPLTNFYTSNIIVTDNVNDFAPGDIAKITVVIWLEGEDPDCNDDILGGQFKSDMVFKILGTAEQE